MPVLAAAATLLSAADCRSPLSSRRYAALRHAFDTDISLMMPPLLSRFFHFMKCHDVHLLLLYLMLPQRLFSLLFR